MLKLKKTGIYNPWILSNAIFNKGQLISRGLIGILNSSKKQTKKFDLQYYDTSGRLVFVRFLEELKTPKSPFESNWPLVASRFILLYNKDKFH